MKAVIFFNLLLSAIFAQGQNTLLKSQVYDFETGDIFMTEYTLATTGGQGQKDYRLDTIKSILVNTVDTFRYVTSSYTFYRSFVFPANVYEGHTRFTDTITITGMDSVAQHMDDFCGIISIDTIKANTEFCGALTWTQSSEVPSQCTYESNLVEGLGGPYYQTSSINPKNGFGIAFSYDLIYYKKSDAECGQIVTSIKDNTNLKSLKLYPNPADHFIVLEGVDLNDNLVIISMDGVVHQKIDYDGQPINIDGLTRGIYFLQVSTKNDGDRILKFVKQ